MSRTFTLATLQGRSLSELQALHRKEMQALICTETGSHERRDALSNLETLSLAIAKAHSARPRL